jgi:ElaB/YqjD/DUF883 family membrane-anchored ribosome-binding protein
MAGKQKDSRSAAERSLREARRDFDKRIDEIRADLKEKGPEAIERVESALNELKGDLQSGFDEIHVTVDDEIEAGRREVREHPLLAVGIAVTVGVVIGMLLGRRRD